MIQANKLRINSVLMWGVKLIIVKGIHTDTVLHDKTPHIYAEVVGSNFVYMCFHLDEVDPIPLTPEILEKCGYRISFGLYHNGSHRIKSSGRGRFIFMPYGTSDINLHIPIDYLHEFQNLIHAITGTELNVQL